MTNDGDANELLRATAHKLLDLMSVYEADYDESAWQATSIVSRELGAIGAVRVAASPIGAGYNVDVSPLIHSSAWLLHALLNMVAEERGTDTLSVMSDLRELTDRA